MLSVLHKFADKRLLSELQAQKASNKQLHKRLKFERQRANGLAVNRKTYKTRCTALRKQVRELEADNLSAWAALSSTGDSLD